jgi:EAL domain-containing protein (putative c-di-GMP-specific phosphodiesterase class I)
MPFTFVAADLEQAVEQQQFMLHFQPEVDAWSARVVGAEALLRWQHPHLGTLLPQAFLGCALRSGMIKPIGEWVIRTACRQLAEWALDVDRAAWTLSVNVEVWQSEQVDFIGRLSGALEEFSVDQRKLCLELTERELTRDIDSGVATIRSLADLGIRVGLDNFGIGLSGFFTLMRLPLSFIKVPARLNGDRKVDTADLTTIEAVATMGHARGLRVIATMVETEIQRDAARARGCDGLQGYLFGPAVPAGAIPTGTLPVGQQSLGTQPA